MNDLSKKEETRIKERKVSGKEVVASSELLQNKLQNYLLLYYQAYLKGETVIESEIRSAFLSLVKQDEDLAFKVRMLQLDYLKLENSVLEGEWKEATEVLFPEVALAKQPINGHRKNTLADYSETIRELLKSTGELRS